MSGTRSAPLTEPVANDVASILRHDLVTPINLIVGYCDLLISEAVDSGRPARVAPLRSIRSLGFDLLHLIDQVLLTDHPERSVGDLQHLANALEGTAERLVASCDLLEVAGGTTEDGEDFVGDLAKIREAGVRMLMMAQALAAGRLPEPGPD